MITKTEHYTTAGPRPTPPVATIQEMESAGWAVRQILYVPGNSFPENAFVVVFERDS